MKKSNNFSVVKNYNIDYYIELALIDLKLKEAGKKGLPKKALIQ